MARSGRRKNTKRQCSLKCSGGAAHGRHASLAASDRFEIWVFYVGRTHKQRLAGSHEREWPAAGRYYHVSALSESSGNL